MTSLSPLYRATSRDRWEAATTVPLVVLGVVFIVAYSFGVLGDSLPQPAQVTIVAVLAATWVVFLFDYVVRIALSGRSNRCAVVRANVVDLLSVIVPMFRATRVVHLLRKIPYFQVKSATAVRTEVVAFAAAYVYFLHSPHCRLNARRPVPPSPLSVTQSGGRS